MHLQTSSLVFVAFFILLAKLAMFAVMSRKIDTLLVLSALFILLAQVAMHLLDGVGDNTAFRVNIMCSVITATAVYNLHRAIRIVTKSGPAALSKAPAEIDVYLDLLWICKKLRHTNHDTEFARHSQHDLRTMSTRVITHCIGCMRSPLSH